MALNIFDDGISKQYYIFTVFCDCFVEVSLCHFCLSLGVEYHLGSECCVYWFLVFWQDVFAYHLVDWKKMFGEQRAVAVQLVLDTCNTYQKDRLVQQICLMRLNLFGNLSSFHIRHCKGLLFWCSGGSGGFRVMPL